MPSPSPQPSSSPPQHRSSSGASKHASKAASLQQTDANIQNFAPVARIMKSALPENAKIAKEAKECMQECVSEFISFITSEGMYLAETYRWILWSTSILSKCADLYHQPRKNAIKKNARPSTARTSSSP